MTNPLLQEFTTPFETAPFHSIKPENFKPAFIKAIEIAKKEIEIIIENSADPTFENTIETLEFSGNKLDRITSIFFNLNSAETNSEIQKIAQEVSPLLTEFSNDITLNERLYLKIKQVYTNLETFDLNTEQKTLLEKKIKSFSRNGANLNDKDKKILRAIDKKLASLKLQFSENILAETQSFKLHTTNPNDLKGIPKDAIEAAAQVAIQDNKKGWIFTLDFPSYQAIMTYSELRGLREKMAKAFGRRGFQKNNNNNEQIVLDITRLRYERAQLLGYKTHADFILEERMAENPTTVQNFLNELFEKALPAAKNEFTILQEFATKDGIEKLEIWDAAFYTEKLKKLHFNLDDEILKPYFELEQVLQGVFTIAGKLYNLHFKKINSIDTYHPEVGTYAVTNSKNEHIAVFYTDFFPRKGKRNGAWMTSYKNQWIRNSKNDRPHISIVCNFSRPSNSKPSLLTFREVTTLFHEFGHALHGISANTQYPSLSGTNVFWDFVELPSQIMENWAYEEEALKLFANHFETKEQIPIELVQKIKESANFMEGMTTLRQLSFGFLDMAWHSTNPAEIITVKSFEKKAFTPTQLYPNVESSCMSTAFAHIFSGGYSSGYYSYKWAEVLDADAFQFFKENGIFDKTTAKKFENNILSKGGTDKPMVLYKAFRGGLPSVDALLKRAGLIH